MRGAGLLAHVVLAAGQRLVAIGIAGVQSFSPVRRNRIDFGEGDDAVFVLVQRLIGRNELHFGYALGGGGFVRLLGLGTCTEKQASAKGESEGEKANTGHGRLQK